MQRSPQHSSRTQTGELKKQKEKQKQMKQETQEEPQWTEEDFIATLNYFKGKSHGLALFTSSGERWGRSLAALQLVP